MAKQNLAEAARRQAERLEGKRADIPAAPRKALRFKNSLYSMTEEDLVWLTEISEALTRATGRVVSKSEVVRLGLRVLRGMNEDEVIQLLNTPIE